MPIACKLKQASKRAHKLTWQVPSDSWSPRKDEAHNPTLGAGAVDGCGGGERRGVLGNHGGPLIIRGVV